MYPGERTKDNEHGRERKLLEHLMQQRECVSSKLTEEEVIAIRLYTGPMYVAYNQETRAALKEYMTAELTEVLEHWSGQPCRHGRSKGACCECLASFREVSACSCVCACMPVVHDPTARLSQCLGIARLTT